MGDDDTTNDDHIVTTFYVDGEVSLHWDRKTGEFVSLYMNSTLISDDFTDMPVSSSIASSPCLNSNLDCESVFHGNLHSISSTSVNSSHTPELDHTVSACSSSARPTSNVIDKPSVDRQESVKSSISPVTAKPPMSSTMTPGLPMHVQDCTKSLCVPTAISKDELPSMLVKSKTSSCKTPSAERENVNSLNGSVSVTFPEKEQMPDKSLPLETYSNDKTHCKDKEPISSQHNAKKDANSTLSRSDIDQNTTFPCKKEKRKRLQDSNPLCSDTNIIVPAAGVRGKLTNFPSKLPHSDANCDKTSACLSIDKKAPSPPTDTPPTIAKSTPQVSSTVEPSGAAMTCSSIANATNASHIELPVIRSSFIVEDKVVSFHPSSYTNAVENTGKLDPIRACDMSPSNTEGMVAPSPLDKKEELKVSSKSNSSCAKSSNLDPSFSLGIQGSSTSSSVIQKRCQHSVDANSITEKKMGSDEKRGSSLLSERAFGEPAKGTGKDLTELEPLSMATADTKPKLSPRFSTRNALCEAEEASCTSVPLFTKSFLEPAKGMHKGSRVLEPSQTVKTETKPTLSPWFSTSNAPCKALEASGFSVSSSNLTSLEKLTPMDSNSMSISHSSNVCTDQGSSKELRTKLTDTNSSPACSSNSHSSHCLRSSCKDGKCRASLIPSTSMASSPGAGKMATDASFLSPFKLKGLSADKNCNSVLPTTLLEQANKRESESAIKTDSTSMEAISGTSSEALTVSRHRKFPVSLLNGNKECTPASSMGDLSPPSLETNATGVENTLHRWADDRKKDNFPSKKMTKHQQEKGERISKKKKEADSSSKSPQGPTILDFQAVSPSDYKGKSTLLDTSSAANFEATSLADNKGKGASIDSPVDEKPTLWTDNYNSLPPSVFEDDKIPPLDYVDEKPSVFSFVDPKHWFDLNSPLDFADEKPVILNSVVDGAHLIDFANTFLSFPMESKKSDPPITLDTVRQQNMKTGKRFRDAIPTSRDSPAKELDQTSPRCSSFDNTRSIPITLSNEKSPVSARHSTGPSAAKSSKRPRIDDLPSSAKSTLRDPSARERTGGISPQHRQAKAKKRPRESDSPETVSPSQQLVLASSSHTPHGTSKGKSSLKLSDINSGRIKRHKTFQHSFPPVVCCRPRNAFILFSMKERQRVAAAHPHSDFGEVSKLVAWSWHNMSDAEKKGTSGRKGLADLVCGGPFL